MLNDRPSQSVEKAWLERVRSFGCVITRDPAVLIHHCVGREGKHNKFHIGRVFVLPLCLELHDVHSNHHLNVTHHRKRFIKEFGLESELFMDMCNRLALDAPLPFGEDVLGAIMDTGR
jgi:hypothetical protein